MKKVSELEKASVLKSVLKQIINFVDLDIIDCNKIDPNYERVGVHHVGCDVDFMKSDLLKIKSYLQFIYDVNFDK